MSISDVLVCFFKYIMKMRFSDIGENTNISCIFQHFKILNRFFFSGHLQMTTHYYEKNILLPSMIVSDAPNLYRDANVMHF